MNKDQIVIDGTSFYVEEDGAGQPIVLLHAGIADTRMWDAQFSEFARLGRVIRYDRRGYGKTRLLPGPYANHQDLYNILRALDASRPILIGCSQGGKTAIDTQLQYPGTARALVLVSSALSGHRSTGEPPPQIAKLDAAEQAGDLERVNELELQIWIDGPNRSPEQVDPGVRALVADMNRIALGAESEHAEEQPLQPPAVQRLSEIDVPTLVVYGDEDQPNTQQVSALLAAGIHGARIEVISGTAHLPNMEKPELFNRLVMEFIASLPA